MIARSARAGLAACLLALATAARAQGCTEPSALDLEPGAPPLTVVKAPADRLALSWQDTAAAAYAVHEGSLDAMSRMGTYDHAVIANPTAPSASLPMPAGGRYYLISADCAGHGGSTGRDSFGRRRPPSGRIGVRVGIADASGVFAATIGLAHPEWTSVTVADVSFMGPFADGAAGDPLSLVALAPVGVVTAATSFRIFDPDPSFPAPAGSPVTILDLLFDYVGSAPDATDFLIVQCDVSDALSERVPGAACGITAMIR